MAVGEGVGEGEAGGGAGAEAVAAELGARLPLGATLRLGADEAAKLLLGA